MHLQDTVVTESVQNMSRAWDKTNCFEVCLKTIKIYFAIVCSPSSPEISYFDDDWDATRKTYSEYIHIGFVLDLYSLLHKKTSLVLRTMQNQQQAELIAVCKIKKLHGEECWKTLQCCKSQGAEVKVTLCNNHNNSARCFIRYLIKHPIPKILPM